jgi:hypothetical protein
VSNAAPLPDTPVLETARLVLRALRLEDAPAAQRHFPRWEIVRWLNAGVPWPYPSDDGGASDVTPMRRLSVLALTLTLTACLPIPNRQYFAPTVSGVVVIDGAPVQNAKLRLSSPFTHKTAEVSTDSTGQFTVGPLRMWRLSTSLLGDPLYQYSLDVTSSNTAYPGLTEGQVGYPPTGLSVFCDLSKPVPNGTTAVYCARISNDSDQSGARSE